MHTLAELRDLLEQYSLSPRKGLGQNFLIDRNLIIKLLRAAGVERGDVILEVGPGAGSLTIALLDAGAKVIACELDEGLANLLADILADRPDFTLLRGDCMKNKRTLNADITQAIGDHPFKLVANLPYGVASPLMLTLLFQHKMCIEQHVTIQKEVADRLLSESGTRTYGELSVMAQALAHIELIGIAPPQCFWPRPKVTSAMVSLRRRSVPLTDDPAALSRCCHTLFTKRRKQLGAILGREAALPEGVSFTDRPEQLTVEELIALSKLIDQPSNAG